MGRPPKPEEKRHNSHVHLRVSRAQKAAWVRAAQPGTLAAWCFKLLNKAAGYSEDKADGYQQNGTEH
jgi:hypothetical protein